MEGNSADQGTGEAAGHKPGGGHGLPLERVNPGELWGTDFRWPVDVLAWCYSSSRNDVAGAIEAGPWGNSVRLLHLMGAAADIVREVFPEPPGPLPGGHPGMDEWLLAGLVQTARQFAAAAAGLATAMRAHVAEVEPAYGGWEDRLLWLHRDLWESDVWPEECVPPVAYVPHDATAIIAPVPIQGLGGVPVRVRLFPPLPFRVLGGWRAVTDAARKAGWK